MPISSRKLAKKRQNLNMIHVTRYRERQSDDRTAFDALLDTEWWGVLATIRGGRPVTIPTLYVRDGDDLLIHGSTGAGTLGVKSVDASASFCVTAMDALKVAYNTFDSSVRYRSAVIYGNLEQVADSEKESLLDRVSEILIPGRTSEVQPMTRKEIAATNLVRLRITEGEWVYKSSSGFGDEPDEPSTAWQGLVPMTRGWGEPQRAPWCDAELPDSVRNLPQTRA